MAEAVVGEVATVPVGHVFADRKAAMQDGLHRSWGKGIDYDGKSQLSVAISLNEGYEDDEDHGALVIYTGEGGQDGRRRQVRDQAWTGGNLGLRNAHRVGAPVRVLRGPRLGPPHGPAAGYRYDGIYSVVDARMVPGRSGFQVCRFRLEAIPGASSFSPEPAEPDGPDGPVDRRPATVLRQVRDTAVARRVKSLYDFRCQVCGEVLRTPGGPYAEGAHVIPLGRPHDGPDSLDNLLCLCPNDHVRFDSGAISLAADFWVVDGASGERVSPLVMHPDHVIAPASIARHRVPCGLDRDEGAQVSAT